MIAVRLCCVLLLPTFLSGTVSWASLSGTRNQRSDLEQTRVFKASLRSEFFSMESHDRTLAYLVGL